MSPNMVCFGPITSSIHFAKLGSHGRKDITKVMAITNRNEMGDCSILVRGICYLDTCKYPAGWMGN